MRAERPAGPVALPDADARVAAMCRLMTFVPDWRANVPGTPSPQHAW